MWPAEVISRSQPRRFHLTCNIKETPHRAADCLPFRKLATGIAEVVPAAAAAEFSKTMRVKMRMAIAVTWREAVGGIPLLSVGSDGAGLATLIAAQFADGGRMPLIRKRHYDRASGPLSP